MAQGTFSLTGHGSGVARIRLQSNAAVTATLSGNAKFYTDSAGTADESSTWEFDGGSSRYVRLASGSETMTISEMNYIVALGRSDGLNYTGWDSPSDGPVLGGDIGQFGSAFEQMRTASDVDFYGDVSGWTGNLWINLYRPSGILTGNINGGMTARSYFRVRTNAVQCRIGYTSHIWPENQDRLEIENETGHGWSIADISQCIKDASKTTWIEGAGGITLTENHASMADTDQGGIWGDFSATHVPTALAVGAKKLVSEHGVSVNINGIVWPGEADDGTGLPAGFGDWWRADQALGLFELEATGDGSGVSMIRFYANNPIVVILDGGAKFYTNSEGTENESEKWDMDSGGTRYIRLAAGTSDLIVLGIDEVWGFGHSDLVGWTQETNAPQISGDLAQFTPTLKEIRITDSDLYGDISGWTGLEWLRIYRASGEVTGILNSSMTARRYFRFDRDNGNFTYISHQWPAEMERFDIRQGAGTIFNVATISRVLVDASNTTWAVGNGGVRLSYHASMADTDQGGLWGDFSGTDDEPSTVAVAAKILLRRIEIDRIELNGIVWPGEADDGTGLPAGFGDWWRGDDFKRPWYDVPEGKVFLPALPGVTGFNISNIVGGTGGQIIKVTNLNNTGEGSFRAAAAVEGPTIIVFEVGGVIDLETQTVRLTSYTTIAGQTAPYPGITCIKGSIGIPMHSTQIIMQHISSRVGEAGFAKGSGWDKDAITTGRCSNVIIDHCLAAWATDENLSAVGGHKDGATPEEWRQNVPHNFVISNTIVAQGLHNSTHSKGGHSKGSLFGNHHRTFLIYGSLYAMNADRNPLFKVDVEGTFVNNWIYRNGHPEGYGDGFIQQQKLDYGLQGYPCKFVIVGNAHDRYPTENQNSYHFWSDYIDPPDVYLHDSDTPQLHWQESTHEPTWLAEAPFWPTGLTAMPLNEVRPYILANVGPRYWNRDQLTETLMTLITNNEGTLIDSETEAGGYPNYTPTFREFHEEDWDIETMTPIIMSNVAPVTAKYEDDHSWLNPGFLIPVGVESFTFRHKGTDMQGNHVGGTWEITEAHPY